MFVVLLQTFRIIGNLLPAPFPRVLVSMVALQIEFIPVSARSCQQAFSVFWIPGASFPPHFIAGA